MIINSQKIFWVLPVISGILLSLTLPFANLSFLGWIALIPLFFFIQKNRNKISKIFWGGFITGTIYFIFVLLPLSELNAWWWFPTTGFFWNNKEIILLFGLLLLAMWAGGLFVALFSAIFSKFYNHTIIRALFLAILWGLFEFLREFAVFGFTWGHIGYSMHENTQILQIAHFLGVYGISSLIVLINILIFSALFYDLKDRGSTMGLILQKKFAIISILILILSHLLGFYVLNFAKTENVGEDVESLTISIVHSSLTTIESQGLAGFATHIELVKKALGNKPDMIIMPENMFPFFIINQETGLPRGYGVENSSVNKLWNEFVEISKENDQAALIFGTYSSKNDSKFNSIIVMEGGLVVDSYNKRALMPFSEIPTKSLKKLQTQPIEKGEKNTENAQIVARGKKISPLICSEVIYPHLISRQGDVIVNVSNDGMFDNLLVGEQNHIMAKFRAVENRQYLFRSVKNGISSIINPFGEVVIGSQKNQKKSILTKQINF